MSTRTKLRISRDAFEATLEQAAIERTVAAGLWERLDANVPRSSFGAANVAYYIGALTIVSAMTWFMTSAWDQTGGTFKLVAALVYAAIFAAAGVALRRIDGLRIPGGLLTTAAVCMTPLAVYGFESATHFWTQGDPGGYSGFYEWIRGSWVPMELATIVVAFATLRFVRFPFLVAPIGFATWYLSMDLASLIVRTSSYDLSWNARATVSIGVGAATILAAFVIDRITRENYAFWLYFFGSMSFWGGIWCYGDRANELAAFGTLVVALGFIAASLVLGRRVLTVFGCLGVFSYLGHLAWIFRESLSFPVTLTLVGLAVMGLGVAFQRNITRIENATNALVPGAVRKMIPRSRAA